LSAPIQNDKEFLSCSVRYTLSLGRVHTTQSDTNTSGIDTSGKNTGKFVIAGANPSKSLPPFIEFLLIVPRLNPGPLRRYLRFIPRLPRRNPSPPSSYALSVNRLTLCSRVPMASGSARPSILRRYRAYLRVPSSPPLSYPPSDAGPLSAPVALYARSNTPCSAPRFNPDYAPISKPLQRTPPFTTVFTPVDERIERRFIAYPYMPPPFRRQSLYLLILFFGKFHTYFFCFFLSFLIV
jgi:hypothetical protein